MHEPPSLRQTNMSASTEQGMKALRRTTSALAHRKPGESLLARFETMFEQADPAAEWEIMFGFAMPLCMKKQDLIVPKGILPAPIIIIIKILLLLNMI